ncbi:vWA domain-containing protein [Candidatus Avelusimicrobium luingense]|uniref:vWA domain-containing protein n=1 Tax=Candidatus Avelusimicrobium luingense TaxID=3416211 RepID=UPI003D1502BC
MELFARPLFLLYALPAIAGALVLFWLGGKLKRRAERILFSSQAYAKLTADLRPQTKWRTALMVLAVFFLFVALAGPQWGTEIIEVQGSFAQTVIAVDVSASMRAQDVKPDRLDSAKTMLRMLISNLKDERIGLIAFTSKAFIQCPITTDEDALRYFITSLHPNMLPVPGTSLAEPVKLAAHMLAKYPGQKALILLTDGEDHSPEEIAAAKEAAQKSGIRIIAIGIGTKEGTLIPDKMDAAGNVLEYKKDKQGNTVVSKLDEDALLALAQATGGAYIPYTSPAQVSAKVEDSLRDLDKTHSALSKHAAYKTRYQWPLVIALLCLSGYLLWPRGKRTRKEQKR